MEILTKQEIKKVNKVVMAIHHEHARTISRILQRSYSQASTVDKELGSKKRQPEKGYKILNSGHKMLELEGDSRQQQKVARRQ